ncbi:MAG: glutamate-5-semialdehyde dehydrogenase [Deltaproteobacteria bacterium]|nr:glutamate-5-semialdehyde dehydrogenase [Deltaproteobacteria bacterium]RLB98504.1 MAG: glutamate-5-semialdehyde dehydrogenase [Deltaproteobacteria bacterium]
MDLKQIARRAKQAAVTLAALDSRIKDKAINAMAQALERRASDILAANQADLQAAARNDLAAPLRKRLKFDEAKIEEACGGLRALAALPDPAGRTLRAVELDHGLELYQVTCPIGVVGVIFESRPDALVQIASLCLKSGNAALLKGGSEAAATNRILAEILAEAARRAAIPDGWMALLESRADVAAMLALDTEIDLIIPRGSNAFVRHIMENTRIPVMGHADGICHVYIDRSADIETAVRVCVDSKCQYPAVCNAAETFLVHAGVAADVLPSLAAALAERGVEIRGCERTTAYIQAVPATEADWRAEYLDLIVSIRIVASLEAAVAHINHYGSGHTDVIVTRDKDRARRFMDAVDSADVFANCSSRFADGFRFGLGAEVGISTHKIHARGPVGLEGMTIYKWRLIGSGQVVADYTGPDARPFTHRPLNKPYR